MKSLRFNYATRYVCVRMIFSHHHGEKGCVYVYSTRSQSELHRNQSIFLAISTLGSVLNIGIHDTIKVML